MKLIAHDSNGDKVDVFKVVFIDDLAFGEIFSGTTNRKLLQLYIEED